MKSKTVKGIKEDLNDAKKQIKSEFNNVKKRIKKTQNYTEDYIAKNPKKAAAFAVGLGAAIGAAITTYWKKKK